MWQRTKKVTVWAITHALVNLVWEIVLRLPFAGNIPFAVGICVLRAQIVRGVALRSLAIVVRERFFLSLTFLTVS